MSPLTDPEFRNALAAMVRRKVPESDAEDIVQAALAEALASASAPAEPDALRRWVWGVARHKVADFYRRARREEITEPPELADEPRHAERDLLRWAEREIPPHPAARETLGWLLREGEGEKLEHIAASERLPPPQVRQRVVRLRKHLRTRWAAEVAALAAIGVLVTIALVLWTRRRDPPSPIAHDPSGAPAPTAPAPIAPEPPRDRAARERALAFDACDRSAFRACLDAFDRAAALDPGGDRDPAVQAARAAATRALAPSPSPSPSSAPSSVAPIPSGTPAPPPAPTSRPTTSLTSSPPDAPTATPPRASSVPAPPPRARKTTGRGLRDTSSDPGSSTGSD